MSKRLISIHSVLVVAIVLLAAFIPSCTEEEITGTIEVKATFCGNPWPPQGTGEVTYTLTGPGSPIQGDSVPASHTVDLGGWSLGNVSGGPSGPPSVCLEGITPAMVTIVGNETKIITIEFEYCEDAWIDVPPLPWTANGDPIEYDYYEAGPCETIDVHFWQGVDGCDDYLTAVNETSWLMIHLKDYFDFFWMDYMAPCGPVLLYAINDWWAVNKTVEEPPPGPPEKVSQNTTLDGKYINPGDPPIELPVCLETWVDVETIWTLVKEVDYLKSINWFGISLAPFTPGMEHEDVLFELVVPPSCGGMGGVYHFQLQASAGLELMDDEDKDDGNNFVSTPTLDLYVYVQW